MDEYILLLMILLLLKDFNFYIIFIIIIIIIIIIWTESKTIKGLVCFWKTYNIKFCKCFKYF